MVLPISNEVKNNRHNYNQFEKDIELCKLFNSMPFYHQISSGKEKEYDYNGKENFNQLLSILETQHLYCDKELLKRGISTYQNTYPSDRDMNRDEYVYLMLGRVVTKPHSKRHISIEIPNEYIPREYDKTLFCVYLWSIIL
ncbi:hypothetical protein [Metabacillus litoralis]|uniref:hypothetical protein n=1 Tax=Metabacillus litoralis TaxID=152268 RepID=UPI000EF5A18B|nr:hypothetical protein [Metabacillus litoralis]